MVKKWFKDHALTHDENRYQICLLCSMKTKVMVEIKTALKNKLNNFINIDYKDARLVCMLQF